MIHLDDYLARITFLNLQFDLCRRAVNCFRNDKSAVEAFIRENHQKLIGADLSDRSKPESLDPAKEAAVAEAVDKSIRENGGKILRRNLLAYVDFAENRVRQSEIILRTALFEEQMKDIHRHVLRAKPTLLKSDRKIDLGRIVASSKDDLIEEEINREIHSLDRSSVEERAKYFSERLKLHWAIAGTMTASTFDSQLYDQSHPPPWMITDAEAATLVPAVVSEVKRVLDIRNKILHEDPDVVVTDDILASALHHLLSVPFSCCLQAIQLYRSEFTDQI